MTEEEKLKISEENPDGGVWNTETKKWKGYKPKKGMKPNWDPFNPEKRKGRLTINEKKFLYLLSKTGNINKSYKSVYRYTKLDDKKLENARIGSAASIKIKRLKEKSPELVAAFTFEDITPDFVRKGLLDLYGRAKESGNMHVEKGVLELMGKIHALFSEKQIYKEEVKEVIGDIYQENDSDMPGKQVDESLSRTEIDEIGKA